MTTDEGPGAAAERVLVVEDDAALRETVTHTVSGAGYQVEAVGDGAAAEQRLRSAPFNVVLLDIGLPFVDGWQVLASLESKRVPSVIIISARGDERDKVRALDMGADDYLAKPFGADELLARIRAVIRRAQPAPGPATVVHESEVTVDLGRRAVLRGGREVSLSPTEYLLLAELARHHHEVLDYRTLLQRVWGPAYADERHYLRTFVQRLRTKLEADLAEPRIITTATGRGYRFGPAVDS
jgi:two-component system, OmpR family, KDP operon response regulator KdpE